MENLNSITSMDEQKKILLILWENRRVKVKKASYNGAEGGLILLAKKNLVFKNENVRKNDLVRKVKTLFSKINLV